VGVATSACRMDFIYGKKPLMPNVEMPVCNKINVKLMHLLTNYITVSSIFLPVELNYLIRICAIKDQGRTVVEAKLSIGPLLPPLTTPLRLQVYVFAYSADIHKQKSTRISSTGPFSFGSTFRHCKTNYEKYKHEWNKYSNAVEVASINII
jgi:hypothetical protein